MFIEFLLGGRQHGSVGKKFLSLNACFTTHQRYLSIYLPTLSLNFPISKKGITTLLRFLMKLRNKLMYVKCPAECLVHSGYVNVSFVSQVSSQVQ